MQRLPLPHRPLLSDEYPPLPKGMIRSVIHTGAMRFIPFGRGAAPRRATRCKIYLTKNR
jgi:hypothetical protein